MYLCFIEGSSMFCLLCKKYQTQCERNKDEETFKLVACIRLKLQSINRHGCAYHHRSSIQNKQLQRVSFFSSRSRIQKSVSREVLEKSLHVMYVIMKEHIPNCKILKLLKFREKSCNEMICTTLITLVEEDCKKCFFLIGNGLKSTIQEKLRNCENIGVLIDEVSVLTVNYVC